MEKFPCPYLQAEVELSERREAHIAARHPDLLPDYRDRLAATLADPDQVRNSMRLPSARLFSRWYDDVSGGKHVVLVVVSSPGRERHWIVTAYIARKLAGGKIEWQRS
jgi:hypothetical protein